MSRRWPVSSEARVGEQTRHPRDRVNAAHALAREAVEVRRPHTRIAREAKRLRAPLVGEHDHDIRRLRAVRGDDKDGEKNEGKKWFHPMGADIFRPRCRTSTLRHRERPGFVRRPPYCYKAM